MNRNQLDRMIQHFTAIYHTKPVEIRTNTNTFGDLFYNQKPGQKNKFGCITYKHANQSVATYDGIVYLRNDKLGYNEVELVSPPHAAKYFADSFNDGPIVEVKNAIKN